ncbi:MAG: hypothetical protein ACRDVP_09435 [Acidimicrobiales bacterium]
MLRKERPALLPEEAPFFIPLEDDHLVGRRHSYSNSDDVRNRVRALVRAAIEADGSAIALAAGAISM